MLRRALVLVLLLPALYMPRAAQAQVDSAVTVPILLKQLAESVRQGLKLDKMLSAARSTVQTVKQYTGYAKDAYEAYQEVSHLTPEAFQHELQDAFSRAFPEVGDLEYDTTSVASWSGATGALQRDSARCLRRLLNQAWAAAGTVPAPGEADTSQCFRTIRRSELAQSLAATFGQVPKGTSVSGRLTVTDEEVVRAMGKSDEKAKQALADRITYLRLEAICRGSKDPAACKAAADLATVAQVNQIADVNTQLATLIRLQSVALAARNAARKDRLRALLEQRKQMLDGFTTPPLKVKLKLPGQSLVDAP